ncbi:hypothetical protein DVV91_12365 [Clostridium botulinum]|uniref:hypothetical protein n=1 Tax=Clostridium botulinum TaxID=1491 RepID=UPI000174E6E6|nr:hypothetical protein [Clostridium botulinum]ACD53625.1 hypothetical protein CLH_2485 [Clostridium botulinum E3 str. Alaska E43]AJF30330.1 hypothetical protein ST13_11700 [Clostridium botulinum]AJF33393.1 hypothetical protein ST12_11700 [Clostridium botulinum]MBN1049413.1 hypothetical protein [Clostridium botulinum]MBN1075133.1 hypothetical protein [Clostridium botulinum]
MKVIYLMEQVNKLGVYPIEVTDTISNTIEVLDENYGAERNIEADLGGYVVIVENTVDIEMLKQDKLKGLLAEYTDIIKCSEGVNWTSSLFLISSDFSIVVITTEELSKFLLE